MRKTLLLFFLTCLLGIHESFAADPITAKYVMLVQGSTYAGLTDDEKAAVTWFNTNHTEAGDGQVIYADNINNYILTPALNKVVWVHLDGTAGDAATAQGLATNKLKSNAITALTTYVKAGGNLYASKYATELVYEIGRVADTYKPNLLNDGANAEKRGINPQIGFSGGELYDHQYHAIFNGLTQGTGRTNIWYPLVTADYSGTGLKWDFNAIDGRADNPNVLVDFEVKTNSIVLGAWEHVVDYACAGLIEFFPLVNKSDIDDYRGRVIANGMGGYDWNNANKTDNVEKLTENILQYLGTQKLRKVAYLLPNNLVDGFSKADALASVDQDDERTALNWFYEELVEKGKGVVLRPKDLADLDPTEYTTMWIHIDRDAIDRPNGNSDAYGLLDHANIYTMLRTYVKNGGNILLTKHAVDMVKGGCIGRAKDVPTTFDVGIGKENNDTWSINAVIGAGYVSDQSTTESYKYWNYDNVNIEGTNGQWATGTEGEWPTVNGNKYVSYFWRHDNCYVAQQRNNDNIFDHRNNHLYYKMDVSTNEYPLHASEGFGAIKYDVINIVGPGYKEDHNCIWVFQGADNPDGMSNLTIPFQNNNKCDVLGQWAHKTQLDNAAIVDFKPAYTSQIGEGQADNNNSWAWNADAWEGHILCIGLGAYEWQKSTSTGAADASENPYLDNIKQLTLNALNVLENDMDDSDSKTFTVGGVTYYGTQTSTPLNYATIIEVDPTLQVYDLTKVNGQIGNGQITDPDTGVTYDITGIGIGAFTNCPSLAYADLMGWKYKTLMPEDVRNLFPAWTLIYLPKETAATSLATCPIKGENIVNTLADDTKVSEKLKLYDNESGTDNTTGWVYHLFANKYRFTANAVEFNRNFSNVNKTTITLPFAITADEAADFGQFYALDKIVGDNIRFAAVSATAAFKPYVFEPLSPSTQIQISAEKVINMFDATPTFNSETQRYVLTTSLPQPWYTDAKAESKGGNLIGEFRPVLFTDAKTQGIYAYRNDGTILSGKIWADPFRAYLKLSNPSSGKAYKVVFDDFTPTGIYNPETAGKATGNGIYYTLQGVKVLNPGPGIYIHNNKKVIIRNK